LDKKIQTGLSLCKSHYEKKNYRPAIEACDQALSEDPNNKEVRSTRAQVLSDLRREMRAIYEDSAIEESLGEIEGAKEKWKKILQNDIESDEYYQRAKRKLQKYGTGI
jgi:tetratricopeptide (TPR) repeat protein